MAFRVTASESVAVVSTVLLCGDRMVQQREETPTGPPSPSQPSGCLKHKECG